MDEQTTEDLHNKFVYLIKDYAIDLVEQGMYEDVLEACEAIVDSHEYSFLDEYKKELTEAEEQWFWHNRFKLNFNNI
jgi:hypothetical protein